MFGHDDEDLRNMTFRCDRCGTEGPLLSAHELFAETVCEDCANHPDED